MRLLLLVFSSCPSVKIWKHPIEEETFDTLCGKVDAAQRIRLDRVSHQPCCTLFIQDELIYGSERDIPASARHHPDSGLRDIAQIIINMICHVTCCHVQTVMRFHPLYFDVEGCIG